MYHVVTVWSRHYVKLFMKQSVGKRGIGLDGSRRDGDGVTRVALFEHESLTSECFLDAGLGGAAQVKPAVTLKRKFPCTFNIYLLDKFIGSHGSHGSLLGCVA